MPCKHLKWPLPGSPERLPFEPRRRTHRPGFVSILGLAPVDVTDKLSRRANASQSRRAVGCEFFFPSLVREAALGTLTPPLQTPARACTSSGTLAAKPCTQGTAGSYTALGRARKKKKLWTRLYIKLAFIPPHLTSLFLSSTSIHIQSPSFCCFLVVILLETNRIIIACS